MLRNQSLRVNKPFDYLKCNTLWDYLESDKIPVVMARLSRLGLGMR